MKLKEYAACCAMAIVCIAAVTAAPAQAFTTVLDFNFADGAYPWQMSLVQGVDGTFYGTTQLGGKLYQDQCKNGCGTVFGVTQKGLVADLHLTPMDGSELNAGLMLDTEGKLYGTASSGGANNWGTVFAVSKTSKLTTVHNFCSQTNCADGAYPSAALIQAADGSLYGTTDLGGAGGYCPQRQIGCGTIFRMNPRGKLETLYSFCSEINCTDGYNPGGLIEGTDGNFYGITADGGDNELGTVFKITAQGTLTTLHSFDGTDSCTPSSLIESTDGNFFGTTSGDACMYAGTVFKMTPAGTLTTLYSFCSQPGCTDGSTPYAGLVQATDGNFYGTTYTLGVYGDGTVFEITAAGTLTTLHEFDGTDGFGPLGRLLQSTSGIFYGTTSQGGSCIAQLGCGTVFSLSTGLGPFVSFVRNPAKVRQPFGILGQEFVGTSAVALNGTPASFTVKSATFIEATVPPGATTGYVTVTTPTGVLTSNVPFRVIQ